MGLALGLVFSLGFVASTFMTPHATAQTGGQRWEYLTVHHGWDEGTWAAQHGRQGWRFVGFEFGNPHILIFERPLH